LAQSGIWFEAISGCHAIKLPRRIKTQQQCSWAKSRALLDDEWTIRPINSNRASAAPSTIGLALKSIYEVSLGRADGTRIQERRLLWCPSKVDCNCGSDLARLKGAQNRDGAHAVHTFANAIDVPMFVLADGRKVDLTHGWGPTQRDLAAAAKAKKAALGTTGSVAQKKTNTKDATTEVVKVSTAAASVLANPNKASANDSGMSAEAKFLRLAHDGGCKIFSTVLGPEANDPHRTHLHLDLQGRKRSFAPRFANRKCLLMAYSGLAECLLSEVFRCRVDGAHAGWDHSRCVARCVRHLSCDWWEGVIQPLLDVFPTWGHSRGWGYGPSSIVGLILIVGH
jgi:Extensin-like protein C-terminus/Protein of unknown function (DUF3309)